MEFKTSTFQKGYVLPGSYGYVLPGSCTTDISSTTERLTENDPWQHLKMTVLCVGLCQCFSSNIPGIAGSKVPGM
jgi:hypothetical protein